MHVLLLIGVRLTLLVCVHCAGSSTTVALLKQVLESQQTQAFVSASLLAEHSPYRNDTEPSTSASNVEFKTALIKHYQLSTDRDEHNRLYVTCQATGERLLSGAVVGGHLFPRKAAVSKVAVWGCCALCGYVLAAVNDLQLQP